MKNNYAAQLQAKFKQFGETYANIYQQFDLDTLTIALHEEMGMGYDRILKVVNAWGAVQRKYGRCLDPKYVEADVLQERMDADLRDVVKDRQTFHDFASRYPELPKVAYTRSNWKT